MQESLFFWELSIFQSKVIEKSNNKEQNKSSFYPPCQWKSKSIFSLGDFAIRYDFGFQI